jgi:hypothetical protein
MTIAQLITALEQASYESERGQKTPVVGWFMPRECQPLLSVLSLHNVTLGQREAQGGTCVVISLKDE